MSTKEIKKKPTQTIGEGRFSVCRAEMISEVSSEHLFNTGGRGGDFFCAGLLAAVRNLAARLLTKTSDVTADHTLF